MARSVLISGGMKTISMFLIALLIALAVSCGNQTDDQSGYCTGGERCSMHEDETACWSDEDCRWDYE